MHNAALSVILSACFAAAAAPAGKEEVQDVKVRPGDTLWVIADKYLKDPKQWTVILDHNTLPTRDPMVALPGMTLKVPKAIIKEDLRAATLIEAVRKVLARDKGKPEWNGVDKGKVLFNGDGLRTLEKSWARVEFFGGHALRLDANSMAILKSPKKEEDHDLFLNRGTVVATVARVKTPSARIVPKQANTKYTARVNEDLSTKVSVYSGAADVEDAKGLKTVEVPAGFSAEVPMGRAPSAPVKMPKVDTALAPEAGEPGEALSETKVRLRAGAAVAGGVLAADILKMSIGLPVLAYRIQIAGPNGFAKPLFDERFDAYDGIDLRRANLPDGAYQIRVSLVDLLGEEGPFSPPRPWRAGKESESPSLAFRGKLEIIQPEAEEIKVSRNFYLITGRCDPELTVTINAERVRKDEDGNFSVSVDLQKGENRFRVEAYDVRGNSRYVQRKITYEPP